MTTRKSRQPGLRYRRGGIRRQRLRLTADEPPSGLLDAPARRRPELHRHRRRIRAGFPGTRAASRNPSSAETHRQTRPRGGRRSKVGMDMGNGHKGLLRCLYRAGSWRPATMLSADRLPDLTSHTDDPHTDLEETLSTYGELIGRVSSTGHRRLPTTTPGAPRSARSCLADLLPSYQSLPEYNCGADRADYETN